MASIILPNAWVILRFPSGHQRMLEIRPDSTISIGKFGSFAANQLLYRPYNLTFEILDTPHEQLKTKLRIVPANELNAEALSATDATSSDTSDDATSASHINEDQGGVQYDIIGEDGQALIRNNRLTIDDSSRQKLSHEEIEALKRAERGGGKDIIAKILENHSALKEKTDFSLHKYTVRKAQKYLRRFTVYPVDVGTLCHITLESNAYRILEIREEALSLLMSWANVRNNGGKWLVVDDTGGLIVAAIAERLGILHVANGHEEDGIDGEEGEDDSNGQDALMVKASTKAKQIHEDDGQALDMDGLQDNVSSPMLTSRRSNRAKDADHMAATSNTITMLHSAAQPNVSILKHFNFISENPATTHPLYTHLKTISWLALLSPELDPALVEPPIASLEQISSWKAGKKSAYWRKRRRWERLNKVVQETRAGQFDGLIIANEGMALDGVLRRLIPLVKGGGQVVAYSATPEALTEVMDLYSRDRRAAFTKRINEDLLNEESSKTAPDGYRKENGAAEEQHETLLGNDGSPDREGFPVNPALLLAPMLQTVRARRWQVLPGRTHPMMTSSGGAEGYIFSGTRVIPVQGRVEARGRFQKPKKKAEPEKNGNQQGDLKRVKIESE